ncbi:M15 family metallopeptidase [Chlorobium sp.]|uniref:M15 family metallopeptidase n=1 Tax=Chlorobium sp. TaxID=1095 RepID=UPI0025BD84DC|nr:M15 family metallopeptidase [Chlorobium sp.]
MKKGFIFLFLLVLPFRVAIARGPDMMFADLADYDASIILDIRYATPNNFTGKTVYPAARCLLRRDVAMRVLKVQEKLRLKGYRLIVFDCYRPLSVQKKFWAILPDERYVADPKKGSRHNRGAAVDVSLADSAGRPLEMPTAYDDFSEKASRSWTGSSPAARRNSELLESAMKEEGFEPFPTEWWHFDASGWELYPVSDFPLEKTGGCED